MSHPHRLLWPLLALPLAALACLGETPAPPTLVPTLVPTAVPPTAPAAPPTPTATAVPVTSVCDMVYADFIRLYCWQASGAAWLIAETRNMDIIYGPQISPNGKQVVYGIDYENGSNEIWVVDIQTLD